MDSMQNKDKLFHPVPKPKHDRRVKKRKDRNEFPPNVRKQIIKDQDGCCQMCGKPSQEIHHVYLKSRGGRGVLNNGMLVCTNCHIPKIHNAPGMVEHYIEIFKERHGEHFYMDEMDLENLKNQRGCF